jgi:Sulfotransferase domain
VKYVFVAALPKSGTTLVAGLLARIDNLSGQHEYIGREPERLRGPFLQLSWHVGRPYAVPYLRRFKHFVEDEFEDEYFSDVGAALQRSVPYLEEVFDPVAIFHLVRDPRDVVRSLYTHRSEDSDRDRPLLPMTEPEVERWLDGDKFTHICMQWTETTKLLASQGTPLVRLEQLVSDYDYVRERMLEPAGLELSRESWQEHVGEPVNAMPSRMYRFARAKLKGRGYVPYRLPPYEEWPEERRREFLDICGETMASVGYDPHAPGRLLGSAEPVGP